MGFQKWVLSRRNQALARAGRYQLERMWTTVVLLALVGLLPLAHASQHGDRADRNRPVLRALQAGHRHYKGDASRATHYGLVAEEVLAVYPELVTRTATGEVQAVKYLELIPMLLNELQRQQQELAELRALVKTRLPDSDLITAGRDLARGEAAQ